MACRFFCRAFAWITATRSSYCCCSPLTFVAGVIEKPAVRARLDHSVVVSLRSSASHQLGGEFPCHRIVLHQHIQFRGGHVGGVDVLEERLLRSQLAADGSHVELVRSPPGCDRAAILRRASAAWRPSRPPNRRTSRTMFFKFSRFLRSSCSLSAYIFSNSLSFCCFRVLSALTTSDM